MLLFSKSYLCIENWQHIIYLKLLTWSRRCRCCHCRTEILKYKCINYIVLNTPDIWYSFKYLFKVLISGYSCTLYCLKLNLIDCCFMISIICKFTNNKPACRWTRWHCDRPMKRSINWQKKDKLDRVANDGCCSTDNVQSFWMCPHHERLYITPLLVQ